MIEPIMAEHQKRLLSFPLPPPGTVFVNQHVLVRTEGTCRVISVHGVVFAHYDVDDHAAEAYAMVNPFESGYADQNDIAEAFGYSARSIRRYQERCEAGNLGSIIRLPGRPSSSESGQGRRDRLILQLKTKGFSNRAIAGRLGLSEGLVRKTLRRLVWQPPPIPSLPMIEAAPVTPSV
jgi:DNA-binding NarL/FixJ family response regulator